MNKIMIHQNNPFRPGDRVRIDHEIRDAYGEVWHPAGSVLEVKYIAGDGEGLMFSSDLGIHYSDVAPVEMANRPPTDRELLLRLINVIGEFKLKVHSHDLDGCAVYLVPASAWQMLCRNLEEFAFIADTGDSLKN